eukprot:1266225-Amphidinium_carterae.1
MKSGRCMHSGAARGSLPGAFRHEHATQHVKFSLRLNWYCERPLLGTDPKTLKYWFHVLPVSALSKS